MSTLRILCLLLCLPLTTWAAEDYQHRVDQVLLQTPLIDGHNDLPWEIRERFKSDLAAVNLAADTSHLRLQPGQAALMTDIPRLRAGHVGAQFWSVWIPVSTQGFEAVQMTLEQIDLVKRMSAQYPADFAMAYSAADIRRIHKSHKIAALIGIEGGHQINNSLAVLRQMYDAGARYMTLTHTSNTPWADSATDAPAHHGLTPFGVEVVKEMNRLGMLVDLSHVSLGYHESGARREPGSHYFFPLLSPGCWSIIRAMFPTMCCAPVAANGGIVMVNFAPPYVSAARNRWEADHAAERTRSTARRMRACISANRSGRRRRSRSGRHSIPCLSTTLAQVADHIEHIRQVAGIDHVGLGSDFDGIPDAPVGLEGVDRYPVHCWKS